MKYLSIIIAATLICLVNIGCDSQNSETPYGWLEQSQTVEGECNSEFFWGNSPGAEFFSMRNSGDTTFVTVLIDSSAGLCNLQVGYGENPYFINNYVGAGRYYASSATFAITDSGIVNFSWWCSSLDSFATSCAGSFRLLRRNNYNGNIYWGKKDTLQLAGFITGQGNCNENRGFHHHKNQSGSTQKILVYMKNIGDCTFKVWGDSTYPNVPMDTLKLAPGQTSTEQWKQYSVTAGTTMSFYAGCTYSDNPNTNFCAGIVRLYLLD